MSFVRPGQNRKKKAFVRRRPQWDDSVSDLDSYRATPDEIKQRQEAHKSKHHISVKLEKIRREKQREGRGLTNAEARQVAIMKEVLHDHQQLDDVLTKSDSMLAVVKDLFGDDAKKFTGHPSVTLRPGGEQSNSLPAAPEIRTRIEKLSESVMSQSALNDLSGSSEYEDEDDDNDNEGSDGQRADPIRFEPRLDLGRFQQIVAEEENRNSNAVPPSSASSISQADLQRLQQILLEQQRQPHRTLPGQGLPAGGLPGHVGGIRDLNHTLSTISGHPVAGGPSGQIKGLGQKGSGPAHSSHMVEPQGVQTPPNSDGTGSTPPHPHPHPQPHTAALNDTGKVKKSRRKVKPEDTAQAKSSSLTMTDLRQVLGHLHAELADFERRTGRRSDTEPQSSETFTGYTVSLVTAVTKLTHYMKETELRLQAEIMVREQLAQDVAQLTLTIDSLTQEMIGSQEEYGKLANEFHRYRQQCQGEMALLQTQVLEVKRQQSAQGSNPSTPGKAASAGSDQGEENYSALPDYMTQPSAAVLLSPVVRKTRVSEANNASSDMEKPKRQTSLVDIPSLVEKTQPPPQQQQQQQPPQQQKQQQQQQHQMRAAAASGDMSGVPSSSWSSGGGGGGSRDPPQLTQTLPVMATVSVPRPIPLVQSNVGGGGVVMALSHSHAAAGGPLTMQTHQGGLYTTANNPITNNTSSGGGGGGGAASMPHMGPSGAGGGGATSSSSSHNNNNNSTTNTAQTSRESNRAMETQIAELNRQHAEAQQRLQSLLVQQKKQGQLNLFDEDEGGERGGAQSLQQQRTSSSSASGPAGGGGTKVRQEGTIPSSVSPPISPISHHSERFPSHADPIQRLASLSREIKVSVPVMDLETSTGSLNTST